MKKRPAWLWPAADRGPVGGLVVFGYLVLSLWLAAYIVSLVTQVPDPTWAPFSDWAAAGCETAASVLCLVRGVTTRAGRIVSLTLGAGLLMWSVGDIVLTLESRGGVTPPTPSWADAFYLAFFPFTYLAVVAFMRGAVRRLDTATWLDGAVAGFGAGAVCAAFAFPGVQHVTGQGPATTVTNLAYPVADLILLSLVVGGSTLMSGRRKTPWLLLALGIAINVVGDTANLFSAALGRLGFVLDALAWPASILLMSMSVWLRPRYGNPLKPAAPGTLVIPGVSAAGALIVLLVGNVATTSPVAAALATATLMLVGIRLVVSVRAMRLLSQERRHQSITDDLTGLGNRRHLSRILDTFFADYDLTSPPRTLGFLFVDLDRFKEINDTYGHPAGDQVLRQLGPRLSSCLRERDLLIRLGGDEFVVLLIDGDADYATTVAERLTQALTEPFDVGATTARVRASIGIALAPRDATDAASLLWSADIAMYRAKLGGVPFACYQADIDRLGNRLFFHQELRRAIDQRQLVLNYQPQLDLRTGAIVAVESLLRWTHPTLGVIPPLEFLPFAEEADLMGAITEMVLNDAVAQCATWREQGVQLSVSVNISASNLVDPGLTGLVRSCLREHAVPGDALVLEITETSIISDFDRSQRVIQELADLGVAVSIDDFGAGYTSLAHLSGLAVSELKLDRTFVAKLGATSSSRDRDLVRATIELGHALGLRLVAEGIEDDRTLRLLADLGCDLGQGYYISVPKPADSLAFTVPSASPVV